MRPHSAAIAVATIAATMASGCRAPADPPPLQQVRVLARVETPKGLVAFYNQTMPSIESSLEIVPGSAFVVDALEHGAAELGYAQADVIYTAYRSGLTAGQKPYTNLRAIAVIQRANVFVVVRRDSGYHKIADLRGMRIGIDPEGSYGAVYAKVLLKAYGLGEGDVSLTHLFPDQMAARMKVRSLDAAIFVAAAGTPIIGLNRAVGVRVLDVDRGTINALRGRYPFLNPSAIPPGEMTDQPDDIHTFGVENVLICRRDLSEDLVYELTVGLFTQAERNLRQLPDARLIDLEQAPATPIPLHPGAARYYREREVLQ